MNREKKFAKNSKNRRKTTNRVDVVSTGACRARQVFNACLSLRAGI